MHYELVAQCNLTERHKVIQEIEMSGGTITDILEDHEKLLLFIEYDESVIQKKGRWLDKLNNLVIQLGDAFTFSAPTA
jgi:16S rRNA A1518/A1519 N6-dimethyltransferase RsmA/KsgA/DIM1 with predicted DNA glycosylase/AP lyase activity